MTRRTCGRPCQSCPVDDRHPCLYMASHVSPHFCGRLFEGRDSGSAGAWLVLLAVLVAAFFTAGLFGIAQQVADRVPTCVVPTATGCPAGPTP